MFLDVSSLRHTLETLVEGLRVHATRPDDLLVRDACIQRFEYCYELSHKMLRRFLTQAAPTPSDIQDLSFPMLIRLGYERGLLNSSWATWQVFREARNATSHAYDRQKADQVFASLPHFLAEAQFLLASIVAGQSVGP